MKAKILQDKKASAWKKYQLNVQMWSGSFDPYLKVNTAQALWLPNWYDSVVSIQFLTVKVPSQKLPSQLAIFGILTYNPCHNHVCSSTDFNEIICLHKASKNWSLPIKEAKDVMGMENKQPSNSYRKSLSIRVEAHWSDPCEQSCGFGDFLLLTMLHLYCGRRPSIHHSHQYRALHLY